MGADVNWSFWSDEDRWFVPRRLGLGYSLNLKYVAKRLGWIQVAPRAQAGASEREAVKKPAEASREDRLRKAIDRSKYES